MVRFESEGSGPEDSDGIAPVIPLFGGRRTAPTGAGDPESPVTPRLRPVDGGAREWHPTWRDDAEVTPVADGDTERADRVAAAERVLLKKLRTRQLSVAESRAALAPHDLPADEVEQLIDGFLRRGYLDDARLAEQLIYAGTERKGQGRRAIAQTLAARGIPRDVVDASLAEQPDDDAERALEFARTKARQLDHVDEETAMRRLMGQLSRRGYPGSVAATAARAALAENRSSGVRFR